jgi:glycosyltransferase involved in cell wall biosynthesis
MQKETITVVLTAFKRIENLELQLEAIKNQSIKPDEIILFQDGTGDDLQPKIPEKILKQFDAVEISKENQGVWARFRFAESAKSKYVCIFDDDTIPGRLWLENCLTEMNKKEGIYGTIGILMKNPSKYPFDGYVRIGWACPNKTAKKVDFVGHSWFLKKEWLNVMFEKTEDIQQLKYVGEDMSLSAKVLQKYGIETFVPPHPFKNQQKWGSISKQAIDLGNKKVAVSHTGNNLQKMNDAINILLNDNWKTVVSNDESYVNNVYSIIKQCKKLTALLPFRSFRHSVRMYLTEKRLG